MTLPNYVSAGGVALPVTPAALVDAAGVQAGTPGNPLVVGASNGVGGIADPTLPSLVEQEDITATGSITTQNLSPTGAATAGSAVEILCYGKGTVSIDVSGTYTGVLSVQATIDGVNWRTISAGQAIVSDVTNSTTNLAATIASAAVGIWRVGCAGYTKMRVTGLAAMTGTAVVALRASPGVFGVEAAGLVPVIGPQAHGVAVNSNPLRMAARALNALYTTLSSGQVADLVTTLVGALITKPYSIPEMEWSYAAISGGTVDTTDVPLKTAAGAGLRNYVTDGDLINKSTTATEYVLKDGATVIWRTYLPASMTVAIPVHFSSPRKTSANTALNGACITTGAAVYANWSGHVAP